MCRARSCACVRRGLVGSEHARGVGRAACWERRLVWATGCAWRPLSSPRSSSSKARHPPAATWQVGQSPEGALGTSARARAVREASARRGHRSSVSAHRSAAGRAFGVH